MNSPQPKSTAGTTTDIGSSAARYRMSELAEKSGATRGMIKYYLRAELLPSAEKPRPNLALYTERHVKLIQLIRQFQAQTKLSLPEIATVFKAAKHNPQAIEVSLLAGKHGTGQPNNIIPLEQQGEQGHGLRLPSEAVAQLVAHGLIPDSASLGSEEERLATLILTAMDEGVPIEFFTAAKQKLKELAELEVQSLLAIKRSGINFSAAAESVTETDRVINRWIISEKTDQARRLFQRMIENSENALASIHDTIYVPSAIFQQRFDITAQLNELTQPLIAKLAVTTSASHREELQEVLSLGRTSLLLHEFDRALQLADMALQIDAKNSIALAIKCLCYGMNKQHEKAVPFALQLEGIDSNFALVSEARILTLLMQAAKLGGVADTTELLKEASDQFRELHEKNPEDSIEAKLILGRATTLFPDAVSMQEEAIETLEGLRVELESGTAESLDCPLPAMVAVYQIYTSYLLAQLYSATGNRDRATTLFKHVIELDPASNFAETAYLQLGD